MEMIDEKNIAMMKSLPETKRVWIFLVLEYL